MVTVETVSFQQPELSKNIPKEYRVNGILRILDRANGRQALRYWSGVIVSQRTILPLGRPARSIGLGGVRMEAQVLNRTDSARHDPRDRLRLFRVGTASFFNEGSSRDRLVLKVITAFVWSSVPAALF